MGIGGIDQWNEDVFQDWASINSGHYQHLTYAGEMEVAFDRAATLMKEPAAYSLKVTSEYRPGPGPGMLSVLDTRAQGREGGAIELILDASGSMLQRIEGRWRIEIAKKRCFN